MEAVAGVTKDNQVVYVPNERVVIVGELEKDYVVENLATKEQFLVDKVYFRRHYTAERELIPLHQLVWDKLDEQARELYHLKRANNRLKEELRSLKTAYRKLKKETKRGK